MQKMLNSKKIVGPPENCILCSRLRAFRKNNKVLYPKFHNAPVQSFGSLCSELIIVGLAPGLKGANQTGRPFTGDYAGDLLYSTLSKFGFSKGDYKAKADDGVELINCRITNAVKCLPPQNKPIGAEVANCRHYLIKELKNMPNLKVILSLGSIAHGAVVSAFRESKAVMSFQHQRIHLLNNGIKLINSYHCSRYNTNTGRLTTKMFEAVFEDINQLIFE